MLFSSDEVAARISLLLYYLSVCTKLCTGPLLSSYFFLGGAYIVRWQIVWTDLFPWASTLSLLPKVVSMAMGLQIITQGISIMPIHTWKLMSRLPALPLINNPLQAESYGVRWPSEGIAVLSACLLCCGLHGMRCNAHTSHLKKWQYENYGSMPNKDGHPPG